MTHYQSLINNKKIGTVIPAACLTILTLISVSCFGNATSFLVPAILIVLIVTITVIIISLSIAS